MERSGSNGKFPLDDDQVLICWMDMLADQPILHGCDRLGHDGSGKYVMYPGYEVGSYEKCYK